MQNILVYLMFVEEPNKIFKFQLMAFHAEIFYFIAMSKNTKTNHDDETEVNLNKMTLFGAFI